MKFITEEDLRQQYREAPFSEYRLEAGARLTPGARQFLGDRGINMFEDGSLMMFHRSPQKRKKDWEKQGPLQEGPLACKEEMLALSFLRAGDEIYPYNVSVAKKILSLGEQFSNRSVTDDSFDQGMGKRERKYDIGWLRHYDKRGKILFILFQLRNQVVDFRYNLDAFPEKDNLLEPIDCLVNQLEALIEEVVGEEG